MNDARTPAPKRTASKPQDKHGMRGQLIRLLYRFRLGGWFLSAILIVYLMIANLINLALPRPVLVVNERDEIVGQIDYTSTLHRTDTDLIAGGKRFLECRLSLNSQTITEDIACALALETAELRKSDQATLITTVDPITKKTYVLAIAGNKTRSWLEFSGGADAPQVVGDQNGRRMIRYKGLLTVVGTKKGTQPFDMTVTLRPAPRHNRNSVGIAVEAFNDN